MSIAGKRENEFIGVKMQHKLKVQCNKIICTNAWYTYIKFANSAVV